MTLSLVPPIWKEAPFIRILFPFCIGVIMEQTVIIDSFIVWILLLLFLLSLLLIQLTSLFASFKFNWMRGMIITSLILLTGNLVTQSHDGVLDRKCILNNYISGSQVKVTLQEPLAEKENSYKAIASADLIDRKGSVSAVNGSIIIYFSRQNTSNQLEYGTQLIFSKPLQRIMNSGNPGAFDYKKYCERQNTYFTVFLSPTDYQLLPGKKCDFITTSIFKIREMVLNTLSANIRGARESGFAKALLIGYKDDLDKNLVQAYSNTGVVHIIAISGLHLSIIFGLLNFLVKPLRLKKYSKWLAPLLVIGGLWGFSFLAGGGPSVLRSAFMFSFIVIGKSISKKSNVLNNLAASAFLLLCINPYWFWDVGFQLSYAAVLSIVLFFKPIYNWFYFENKLVDFVWKLNAVTISAQIFTIPISIYHFHQLPVYFLFANLLAVPWSSLILIGEIGLCVVAFSPSISSMLGALIEWFIHQLNNYIEYINNLPFSIWSHLQISTFQLSLMVAFISMSATYLLRRKKYTLIAALFCLFLFVSLRSYAFIQAGNQRKIIVYNILHTTAIDFIDGRKFVFIGDHLAEENTAIQRFYLLPARSVNRTAESDNMKGLLQSDHFFQFYNRSILIIDSTTNIPVNSFSIDLLLLSKNPRIALHSILDKVHAQMVVADPSNHPKKLQQWKKLCDSLGILFYDVSRQGAFQLDAR
jgi:competence protein ComEC